MPLDMTNADAIHRAWQQYPPDAVLHTAAMSKANQCEQAPDASYRINVEGTLTLARLCAAAHIPLIFTSTDLVFDGHQPPYGEADRPTPINLYGRHKATAEMHLLQVYPEATVCRLPLLYGAPTATATGFLQNFLTSVAAGRSLTLFTDEVRTPVAVSDVVQGLFLVLQQGITGRLHLGGPERLNRYELGLKIAQAFNLSSEGLLPGTHDEVELTAPRPKDVSLDSRKAFALGYAPRDVETALQAIAADPSRTSDRSVG
jgi:dTDP-4-dehydrorhamnose reductase